MTCLLESWTSWLGDGLCDDGEYVADFACEAYEYDMGDCPDPDAADPEPGDSCGTDLIYDCSMACISSSASTWLGDGVCDDGTYGV